MTFWDLVQANWGWITGVLVVGFGTWFRQDIAAWWLKEQSADRASGRRVREQQAELERESRNDQTRVQDRLFDVLKEVNVALAQVNVVLPALLPAIIRQIQDSDTVTHTMLREILSDTRDLNEDVAGIYAATGKERPSRIRKKNAAQNIPPAQSMPASEVTHGPDRS